MSEQTQEEFVQAVYQHAADLMKKGAKNEAVVSNLIEQGLDEESANTVVNNLIEVRNKQKKEQGKKNMLFGALWGVGGIIVTAATYGAASAGGHYVVAWGAIVFGVIQFFGGVLQYSR